MMFNCSAKEWKLGHETRDAEEGEDLGYNTESFLVVGSRISLPWKVLVISRVSWGPGLDQSLLDRTPSKAREVQSALALDLTSFRAPTDPDREQQSLPSLKGRTRTVGYVSRCLLRVLCQGHLRLSVKHWFTLRILYTYR